MVRASPVASNLKALCVRLLYRSSPHYSLLLIPTATAPCFPLGSDQKPGATMPGSYNTRLSARRALVEVSPLLPQAQRFVDSHRWHASMRFPLILAYVCALLGLISCSHYLTAYRSDYSTSSDCDVRPDHGGGRRCGHGNRRTDFRVDS